MILEWWLGVLVDRDGSCSGALLQIGHFVWVLLGFAGVCLVGHAVWVLRPWELILILSGHVVWVLRPRELFLLGMNGRTRVHQWRVRDDNLFSFLWCSYDGFEFLDAGFDLGRISWRTWRNFLISVSFFFFFSFFICVVIWVCICIWSLFFFSFFVCVVVIWVWVLVAGFDWEEQEEQVVMF